MTEVYDVVGRDAGPPRAMFVRRAIGPLAVLVAMVVVAFVVGLRVGRPDEAPAADSVDVRALQDLRYHAEQVVGLGLVLLAKPDAGANAQLRRLARTIVTSVSEDRGRMAQLLTSFGAPLDSESDTALGWTGAAVPINEMPGLAGDDDTTLFEQAAGGLADQLFARLVSAHHEGAVTIAGRATALASRADVRALLYEIVAHRQDELRQLRGLVPTS